MTTLVLLLLMNVAGFVDYRQTVYISKHPIQYYEINPILGKHPSVNRVNTYFMAGAVIKNGIFFALPDKYKAPFAVGMTTVSTGLAIYNNSIGIKVDF